MEDKYILSKEGLLIVEEVREAKGWKAQSAKWCSIAGVKLCTLRNFRERLRGITKNQFKALCEAIGIYDWEKLVERPLNKLQFFEYNHSTWVGREKIIAALLKKLQSQCRLLMIVGITGIGKTTLAERLLVELYTNRQREDEPVRVNLDSQESTDFTSFAKYILEKCSQPVELQQQQDNQVLLSKLIQYLQTTERLIVIDSFEKLLQGNETEGWREFEDEWFDKFFYTLITTENFQSRIIITSQDLPSQIQKICYRYDNLLHCEALSGLEEKFQLNLFQKIFKKRDLEVEIRPQDTAYLERFGKAYEGHPLALRLIGGEICNKPFNGNVVAYWSKYGNEIEKIEQAIAEAQTGNNTGADDNWQLDRFSKALRTKVRQRLEDTLNRLERDARWAYILLCEASVYRLPVPEKWWLNHLEDWDVDEQERIFALETLKDRYLLEEVVQDNQCKVRQHNLVRSVTLELLHTLGE